MNRSINRSQKKSQSTRRASLFPKRVMPECIDAARQLPRSHRSMQEHEETHPLLVGNRCRQREPRASASVDNAHSTDGTSSSSSTVSGDGSISRMSSIGINRNSNSRGGIGLDPIPQLDQPLEELIHTAFSRLSAHPFTGQFLLRTMARTRQTECKPPASKFAMENLLADRSGCHPTDPCPNCQEELSQECKLLQMPCKHLYHRECLLRWLSEHNTCPICRSEIESQCPRYNEANYDRLRGKLDEVTVRNHVDPSKIEQPSIPRFVFAPPSSSLSSVSTAPPGVQTQTFRASIQIANRGTDLGFLMGMGNAANGASPETGGNLPSVSAQDGSGRVEQPTSGPRFSIRRVLPASLGSSRMPGNPLPESSLNPESPPSRGSEEVITFSIPLRSLFTTPTVTPFGDSNRGQLNPGLSADGIALLLRNRLPEILSRSPPLPEGNRSGTGPSPTGGGTGQESPAVATRSRNPCLWRGLAGSRQSEAATATTATTTTTTRTMTRTTTASTRRGRKRKQPSQGATQERSDHDMSRAFTQSTNSTGRTAAMLTGSGGQVSC